MKTVGRLLIFASICAVVAFVAHTQQLQNEPKNGLLDINTATLEQLKALPGMGVVYAQRVIAGRPYTAKNQLVTRGIIPAEAYVRMQSMVVAHRGKSNSQITENK